MGKYILSVIWAADNVTEIDKVCAQGYVNGDE